MNEADPPPINLDELRLLPDWLREEGPPPSKQYAAHDGADAGDPGARRGSRPGGFGRDSRGPRDRPAFGGGGGGGQRREGGRRSGPPPRGGTDRPMRDERRPAPVAPSAPAPVRIEFLPDEKCLASINKQIRATHMAYPLFGLARMFLQEPARHWVQLSVLNEALPSGVALYQLGDEGPVTLDRAVLERVAFDSAKDRYYVEQSEQKDPPKGNYTNVARNRLSGALLGPTNYHGYQPSLRADYESRYSRRMSFEDYRRNIEIVNDPALVERWKEEARTTTTISTREGEPPTVLQTESDARVHFRQHYLDQLVRTGTVFKVHGSVARNLPEPAMMQAIRYTHETELRYPAQFVQLLRQGLQNAGLHIFKHRKRVVYVSLARPTPFAPDGAVSENVAAILETVAQFPLCTRKALAEHVLARKFGAGDKLPATPEPTPPSAPSIAPEPPAVGPAPVAEASAQPDAATPAGSAPSSASPAAPPAPLTDDPLAKAKAALAADLRFLVQAGHLIEFHNGTFDLPLPPKAREDQPAAPTPARKLQPPKPEPTAEVEKIPAANPADADAVEAERASLTVESVIILPPDAPRESEPAPALESGLENTEAQPVSEPGHTDSLGISAAVPLAPSADPVVIGDVEAAHPISPL